MDGIASAALPFVEGAVTASFVLLALIALTRARRLGRAGWWVSAAFGTLAIVTLVAQVTTRLDVVEPAWLPAVQVALLLAFPYLLLRFTASFRRLNRWLEGAALAAAVGTSVAAIIALPMLTADADPSPAEFGLVAAVLSYWILLSLVTVVRLWRAGRGQPTVARRRMRLMSGATAVLALALLATTLPNGTDPAAPEFAAQGIALLSALAFGLGLAPPRSLRLTWRQPEDEHLRNATMAVLGANSVDDVASRLLPPTVGIVGGAGAVLLDAHGEVVASHQEAPEVGSRLEAADTADRRDCVVVPIGEERGRLVVWTSPYTPFFGREEVDLVRTMGAIAGLALERCELLEEERAQRASLERAREVAEQARQEAHDASMAKSQFLSRMSHELRTPLNAILGFGQLLETSTLDADDREGVGHILKAGRHLLALINDVLDLSRIEAGTFAISLEPVQARELIEDTIALIRPQITSRSIQLTTETVDCEAYVLTDRQRSRQVLLNLLSNAVKYNHDGGRIDVGCSLSSTDRTLRIAVSDTGPGIDEARRGKLFEPFERLGAETSGIEGTGLGLALTKQLIERLGGAIGLDPGGGVGSTFWIDLPLAEAPVSRDGDEEPAEPSRYDRAGGRTLLLIEDNLANLRVVDAMLRRRPGISVLPAMQGTLALELAYEHRPDVIVLDLHLPDLPGRDVLSRLKADPRTRDIPVVIASADATPNRIRQLREEGAFDYLTKPLDLQAFLGVVDTAIADRDARRSPSPDDPSPGTTLKA